MKVCVCTQPYKTLTLSFARFLEMADVPEIDINTLRVTGVALDNDRLYPTELPVMFVPACAMCQAPAMERPCDTCGLPYCYRCTVWTLS